MAHQRFHVLDDGVRPPEKVPNPSFENFCVCGRPIHVRYERWMRTGSGTGHFKPDFYASKWSKTQVKECPGCGIELSRKTVFGANQHERRMGAAVEAGASEQAQGLHPQFRDLIEGCGLYGIQRLVLMALLVEMPDFGVWFPMGIGPIARLTGGSERGCYGALNALELRGLVQRRRGDDPRAVNEYRVKRRTKP